MEALIAAAGAPAFPAEVVLVLSNRPDAAGLTAARAAGLPAETIDHQRFGRDRVAHEAAIDAALRAADTEIVCLAGYMRLLSPGFIAAFPNRILNIHPSLLPSFPGLESQRQALEYGVKFAGCTVHFVDENLDAGPIVLQAVVPIKDEDTDASLSERILKEEHRIYSEAVKMILKGNFKISGRRVVQS